MPERILPDRASAFHRWCLDQQPNTSPSRVITAALSDRSWPVQSNKLHVLLTCPPQHRGDVKKAHALWRKWRQATERMEQVQRVRPDLARLAAGIAHLETLARTDIRFGSRGDE